jgi:hypothetical protein
VYLGAEKYLSPIPAEKRSQLEAFEQEWKKQGVALNRVLEGHERPSFDGTPAAYRAAAEAAFSEVKVYFDASLEYGRNTVPDAGLFYIGSALSQLEFARLLSGQKQPQILKRVAPASLADELEIFENALLAAYKPPASIDFHPVFIRTSAIVKQAHELLDSGMTYGALYRYLDARVRLSKALPSAGSIDSAEAIKRAAEVEKRLKDGLDHSIAQIFLEMALFEAANATEESKGGETARVIFEDVLPHYFTALEPSKLKEASPPPVATVTLVRWPYT